MDFLNLLPLPHLDLSGTKNPRDEDRAYFKFYGLDFDAKHIFGSVTCESKGQSFEIACHVFHPEISQGSVFFIHGLYDHSGLSTQVIKAALDQNLSVCVFDLPGHGLSSGIEAAINSFDQYVDVFKQIISRVSDAMPYPWHACAQSTGASVLMLYARFSDSPVNFQSYSLFSPLVRPRLWQYLKFPYYLLRNFIKTRPRKFNENSTDLKFLEFVKNDPLQSKKLSVQWLNAMNAHYVNFISAKICAVPLIIFQGTNDTTVDWKFNLSVIKKVFSNVKVFIIKDAGHQLINECENIRIQWLNQLEKTWQQGDIKK